MSVSILNVLLRYRKSPSDWPFRLSEVEKVKRVSMFLRFFNRYPAEERPARKLADKFCLKRRLPVLKREARQWGMTNTRSIHSCTVSSYLCKTDVRQELKLVASVSPTCFCLLSSGFYTDWWELILRLTCPEMSVSVRETRLRLNNVFCSLVSNCGLLIFSPRMY